MDRSEALAESYLNSLSLGEVRFEPDGSVPPDFAVGSSIAVEVRRLNQNFESDDGGHQGLEVREIPLRQKLRNHLRSFAPSKDGECWYVGYRFRRPLEPIRTLLPLLDAALRSFLETPVRTATKRQITKHFEIDFFSASIDHGSFFVLGANMDDDSGGWVEVELLRNLRICIADKERKIARYRPRYQQWWLVLDDHIDFGIDDEDRARFRRDLMPSVSHAFDRVVLLDPRDYRRSFIVAG